MPYARDIILGPLLFILYTADFYTCITNCNSHFYADDSQVYYSYDPDDAQFASTLINNDLNKLIKFSKQHNLHINPIKSSLLIFGNQCYKSSVENLVSIKLGDLTLPVIDSVKNLGLIIDSNLKFSEHISKCLQRAYCSLKLLYSNRFILNQNLKQSLCDQLVLSHFNYCDTVYGSCIDFFDTYRVQRMQNNCCRFILNLRKYDHVSRNIINLKWLNMKNRRLLHSATLLHKVITNKSPRYLSMKLKHRCTLHNANIRNPYTLHIPQHRIKKYQQSFSYQGPYIYNNIDDHLKALPINSFRRHFKKILLSKQSDDINYQ